MLKIEFYGKISDQFGPQREISVAADGMSVQQIVDMLASETGAETIKTANLRFALDEEIVPDTAIVKADQILCVMSPFSGG